MMLSLIILGDFNDVFYSIKKFSGANASQSQCNKHNYMANVQERLDHVLSIADWRLCFLVKMSNNSCDFTLIIALFLLHVRSNS